MRRIAAPPSAKIASVSAHDQHSGAQVEPTADVERAVLAGVASARLLAEPASWINRRVETIELLTHEETRRRVSIDFTLLPEVRRDLELDDGVVVPISVLTKEPRRKFDLRDESGRAVPVLGRSQNGELAHLALLSAALDVLGADPPADVYEDIAAHLRRIVVEPPVAAAEQLAYFIGSAENGDEHRAAIWYRARFFVECPGASRAASFHVEVATPEELRFDTAALLDANEHALLSEVDRNVDRASLYADRGVRWGADVQAYVEVAPERHGRTFQAAATSVVVASLLWLGVVSELDSENPGAAVSILLAGAALFSGLSASQGAHKLVRMVFSASSRWLAVVTVAALAASATLAMEFPEERPICVWQIAAIACTVATVRLCWSALRAPK